MLVYHDYQSLLAKRQRKAVIPAAAAHNMGVVVATPLAGLLFADEPRRSEAVTAIADEVERERVPARPRTTSGRTGNTCTKCLSIHPY